MGKPIGQRNGGAGGRDRGVGNHQPAANPNNSRLRLPSGLQGPVTEGGKYGMDKIGRREEAIERQSYRNSFTPEQQIQRLDIRLGVGKGAEKERTRLQKLIDSRKAEFQKEQAKPIDVPPAKVTVFKSNAKKRRYEAQQTRKGKK